MCVRRGAGDARKTRVRTEIVCCHHDTVFILDGEYAGSCDDRLPTARQYFIESSSSVYLTVCAVRPPRRCLYDWSVSGVRGRCCIDRRVHCAREQSMQGSSKAVISLQGGPSLLGNDPWL